MRTESLGRPLRRLLLALGATSLAAWWLSLLPWEGAALLRHLAMALLLGAPWAVVVLYLGTALRRGAWGRALAASGLLLLAALAWL